MDNATLLAQLIKKKTGPVPIRAREARRLALKSQLNGVTRRIAALKMEAMRLYLPLPAAEAFHASTAKWRVIDGSNRAGKTLAAAAEAVRAWLGCDPHDKYPKTNGNSLVVGLDGDHIAMMWKKCAEPGAFSMIRDERTRLWRAVRPDPAVPTQLDPYDDAYREKWREAPPLISPRMISGRPAWDDRAKGIPRYVKFTTGWTSLWRSSEGKSPQGEHYNLGWVDEQITNEQFYLEMCRGLVGLGETAQHKPRGMWSATPQTSNPQLLDLRESADAGSEDNNAFQLLIDDNPFIPADEKRAFFESLSDDEREVRYYGKYAITGRRVYPSYNAMGIHGCEPFEIPPHWTRYVWVDPGRQHCGCLFFAIDPDEKHVYVYDGFDLRNGTAQKWAAEVKQRETEHSFEAFGIDQQMGKETPVGHADNVAHHYFQALLEVGVRPRTQGALRGFFPGSPDIPAREEALLRWLSIRGDGPFDGTAKLQVFRGHVPDLDRQFKRAHMDHKRANKRAKVPEDVLVCLEYFAAFDPKYREPVLREKQAENPVYDAMMRKKRKQPQLSGSEVG